VSGPKLHHYVPQFYLKRFTEKGRFWVFDKKAQRVFSAGPRDVAAQTYFYRTPLLENANADPLFLENELSRIESAASSTTAEWLVRLKGLKPYGTVEVSKEDRVVMSRYVALQWLRTTGTQDILELLVNKHTKYQPDEMKNLHHCLLVLDDLMLKELAEKIRDSIWIFGRNPTPTPFVTSDNPVTVHAPNHMWLRSGIIKERGTCVSLPISPTIIFFAMTESIGRNWPDSTALSLLFCSHESWLSMKTRGRFVTPLDLSFRPRMTLSLHVT